MLKTRLLTNAEKMCIIEDKWCAVTRETMMSSRSMFLIQETGPRMRCSSTTICSVAKKMGRWMDPHANKQTQQWNAWFRHTQVHKDGTKSVSIIVCQVMNVKHLSGPEWGDDLRPSSQYCPKSEQIATDTSLVFRRQGEQAATIKPVWHSYWNADCFQIKSTAWRPKHMPNTPQNCQPWKIITPQTCQPLNNKQWCNALVDFGISKSARYTRRDQVVRQSSSGLCPRQLLPNTGF